jgi:hypothetical protein
MPNSSQYGGINNGNTFSPLIIVDLVNKTASLKTITNTTGVTLTARRYMGFGTVGVDEQYIYYFAYDSPYTVWAIDYVSGTSASVNVGIAGSSEQTGQFRGGLLTPELFYAESCVWDKVNNTSYPMNGGGWFWQYNDDIDALIGSNMGGTLNLQWQSYHIKKNPLILATINNLDTPVTKTAAQTMKITYTLSKASE